MRSVLRRFFVGVAIALSLSIGGLLLLGIALILIVIYLLVAQVEFARFSDPTGEYEVVLTYPKIYHVIPAMPGQGSDMSGTIAIYDLDGNFYGGDTLDFIRDGHNINWTDTGASLQFVGEWNFDAGTYAYSSDDGQWIVKQVRQ